jgi:pimeloyl-ACP methyl ester carboxylesterase
MLFLSASVLSREYFRFMAVPVLVCLHGLGRSSEDWNEVRPGLQRYGRVVAPELPRDVKRAKQIAAAATPEGAFVLGHSMGALIAMRLAAEPHRDIQGLVLSSSFFPPARGGRSLAATVQDYASHRLAFMRDLRAADRIPGAGDRSVRGLGYLVRTAARRGGFRATTEAIGSPVLVVHAADDHFVPLDFALAGARHPGWSLAVLAEGGHYPHLRRPREWLAAVGPWLEQLIASRR